MGSRVFGSPVLILQATNGSAISLPLKSAMSKHTGESSKSTSSSQRHIAFTPSAGDEPLEPTATSSLKKLDHSDVPALKKVLSCARAGNQQVGKIGLQGMIPLHKRVKRREGELDAKDTNGLRG